MKGKGWGIVFVSHDSHVICYRVGDIGSLSVEVVVNPTNETLTDKNPVSSRLFEVAGPELKEECKTQIISESSIILPLS